MDSLSPYSGCVDRPIFIGASPRSGTTLLRTMLNTHPDIGIPRETRFMPYTWETRWRWNDVSRPETREAFARFIFEEDWTRAERLETPQAEVERRLRSAPPTLGSLIGTCYLLYAEATGKSRWGDKRPMYARYLDSVFTFFPDAQFINVVRDPRASVASMRRLNWFEGDTASAVELWDRSLRAVQPWQRALHADQYLDVKYEDLVADSRSTLESIADYLSIDRASVPIMLSYHEHVDEDQLQYHGRLRQPVTDAAVHRWEGVLSSDEVALVEYVGTSWMKQYGYEPTEGGRRPSDSLLARYQARSHEIMKLRRKVQRDEFKRLIRNHGPMAARLTTGQKEIGVPAPRPPVWKRQIGKPR